ncbi:MAG: diacylglycerol/lipid kinase family protein [Thermoanaerobaculia bacterium]
MQASARAHLIYNPTAGRGDQERLLPHLLEALVLQGWRVTPVPTGAAGDASHLARAAVESRARVVFALGGDGHLREVAKGLLGTAAALAPLPGGTVNVVAREFGLGSDPVDVARRFGRGSPVEVDVGLCGDEPFLMQATTGLDAVTLSHVPAGAKRRLGVLAVVAAGIASWWHYRYPTIHLTADGEPVAGGWVAVCNLARYAGDFRLGEAHPADGRLELVLLSSRGRRATLKFALALALGQHRRMRSLLVQPVDEVVLTAPEDLPLQLDGDPVALSPPVAIRLHRQRLKLLLPAGRPEGRSSARRTPR